MIIRNHVASGLSELDLLMIKHVPEGGNWQDIPPGLSQRVDQIRERSKTRGLIHTTYYGRLRWDAPSYTISTFFSRSGNGCFIHPTQDRLISAREAARLQSFPDSFAFSGPNRAVASQIGNAVPPLLGAVLGEVLPGETVVDLFSGAGGLSYGLEMAGKKVRYAAELDQHAADTYRINHPHASVKALDLAGRHAMEELEADISRLGGCELLVGGPPCQSFSTAGRRSADERSTLVNKFVEAAKVLRPPTVVMENVLGLRSFRGGSVLQTAISDLTKLRYNVELWDVNADRFAIPQRRRRLIVVGSRNGLITPPKAITPTYKRDTDAAVSVRDAIADLPALEPGRGSATAHVDLPTPSGWYQEYVRGDLPARHYLEAMYARWSAAQSTQMTLE